MYKKLFKVMILITIIAAILAITLNSAFATTLSDIENHKNETAIQFLTDVNIIQGYPDGTFKPDQGINRAEILKILFEASDAQITPPMELCFPDVPVNEWFSVYVCSAKDINYAQGYPDGNFRPGDNVNKVEAIKLLAKFAEWNLDEAADEPLFDDTDASQWYVSYLKYAKKKKLIEYEGNIYNPGDDMTRGELAESVFRTALVKYLQTEEYSEDDVQTYLDDYFGTVDGTEDIPIIPETEKTLPTSCTNANDALTVVKNDFVENSPHKTNLMVLQRSETLKENEYFGYFDNDGDGQVIYLDPGEEKWFFWIDLMPEALFDHDAKVVTVNMDCTYEDYDTQLYPVINGNAIWKTFEERLDGEDVKYEGEDISKLIKQIFDELSKDDPRFGTCGADPNELKRAVILYLSDEQFIKRNAVNMYNHLCNNNYITTVITGTDSATVLNEIENELRKIETESHNTGYKNVHFHVSSHGKKNTGDLFVNEIITISTSPPYKATLSDDLIDLDVLAAKFGEIGFTVGTEGIWTDSFTIIHDTCFSGNAVPKYQAEAYIPNVRETAVGWVAAASQSDKPAYGTTLRKQGQYFTNALIQCLTSSEGYGSLSECVADKIKELPLLKIDDPMEPVFEKLSPLTDDYVPFFP